MTLLQQALEALEAAYETLDSGSPNALRKVELSIMELRRAIAQGMVVQQGWRPISEAPKDGAAVMVYGPWAGEIAGVTDTPTMDIASWRGGKSDFAGDDWWMTSTGDAYACWIKATHFVELPPAPITQEDGK